MEFFFTSAIDGGEWSASRPYRVTPWERASGKDWIGGWVSPRTRLDTVERANRLLSFEYLLSIWHDRQHRNTYGQKVCYFHTLNNKDDEWLPSY
jgi:hypothetical protein